MALDPNIPTTSLRMAREMLAQPVSDPLDLSSLQTYDMNRDASARARVMPEFFRQMAGQIAASQQAQQAQQDAAAQADQVYTQPQPSPLDASGDIVASSAARFDASRKAQDAATLATQAAQEAALQQQQTPGPELAAPSIGDSPIGGLLGHIKDAATETLAPIGHAIEKGFDVAGAGLHAVGADTLGTAVAQVPEAAAAFKREFAKEFQTKTGQPLNFETAISAINKYGLQDSAAKLSHVSEEAFRMNPIVHTTDVILQKTLPSWASDKILTAQDFAAGALPYIALGVIAPEVALGVGTTFALGSTENLKNLTAEYQRGHMDGKTFAMGVGMELMNIVPEVAGPLIRNASRAFKGKGEMAHAVKVAEDAMAEARGKTEDVAAGQRPGEIAAATAGEPAIRTEPQSGGESISSPLPKGEDIVYSNLSPTESEAMLNGTRENPVWTTANAEDVKVQGIEGSQVHAFKVKPGAEPIVDSHGARTYKPSDLIPVGNIAESSHFPADVIQRAKPISDMGKPAVPTPTERGASEVKYNLPPEDMAAVDARLSTQKSPPVAPIERTDRALIPGQISDIQSLQAEMRSITNDGERARFAQEHGLSVGTHEQLAIDQGRMKAGEQVRDPVEDAPDFQALEKQVDDTVGSHVAPIAKGETDVIAKEIDDRAAALKELDDFKVERAAASKQSLGTGARAILEGKRAQLIADRVADLKRISEDQGEPRWARELAADELRARETPVQNGEIGLHAQSEVKQKVMAGAGYEHMPLNPVSVARAHMALDELRDVNSIPALLDWQKANAYLVDDMKIATGIDSEFRVNGKFDFERAKSELATAARASGKLNDIDGTERPIADTLNWKKAADLGNCAMKEVA